MPEVLPREKTKTPPPQKKQQKPTNRKKKIKKSHPCHPHEKQAMENYQSWEVADVFLRYSPCPRLLSPELLQSLNQSTLSLLRKPPPTPHLIPAPPPKCNPIPSPMIILLLPFQVRMKTDHRSGSDSRASARLRSRHCFLWAGQSLCWHWDPQ